MSKTLTVTGMACGGCEDTVEEELLELDGVTGVAADHESDTVEVTMSDSVTNEELTNAIQSAGFELN